MQRRTPPGQRQTREGNIAPIDPVFDRQFGWANALTPEQFLGDPANAVRMLASYRDDPNYVPPQVPAYERTIDGPFGESSLRVRIYQPESGNDGRAALVWAHGGGFGSGDVDMLEADGVSRELVARGNVVVVSVDYHVASAVVSYPTLHQEVLAAYQWTVANADELGVDSSRISLGGASAGANLAVAATLELRDRREMLPNRVVLVYPALHNELPKPLVSVDFSAVPLVLRLPNEAYGHMIAGYRGATQDPAPYLTVDGHDLSGLPDTLVIPAEYDHLRASADRFAKDASEAGTRVTSILGIGMAHGFINMTPAVTGTGKALDDLVGFIV